MTLKNCSKGYHPVAGFFTATLKRQTGITLLFTAFLLLICPGILWRLVADVGSGSYSLDSELAVWAALIFAVSLLLGIILLCYNHLHLFSKTSADLYYSLPLKRDTLLTVRFGASAVGAIFAMTVSFSGLTMVNFMPYVDGIGLFQMLKLYALCLMLLLLCLSVILVFVANAGSVFHFIFSMLVVCVGIPLLCLIGYSWYENAAESVVTSAEWMQYISPFGYAILQIAGQESLLRKGKVIIDVSTALISVGGVLLFCAISYLTHHRRKAERAGGSFAYATMPVLLTVIAAALGGYAVGLLFQQSAGRYDYSFWLAFMVGAALVAVAAGAIIAKGFRKIWRWFLCAAVATTAMFCLFAITDSLGERDAYRVPKTSQIKSVTIEGNYNGPEVTFTENFELVTKLHSHMVALELGEKDPYWLEDATALGEKFITSYTVETEDYNYKTSYGRELLNTDFAITYELKNGKTISRRYWVNDHEGLLLLLDIVQSDVYAAAWETDLNFEGLHKPKLDYYNQATDESDVTLVTPEKARNLFATYGRELQQMKKDTLFQKTEYITATVYTDNGALEIKVPESFVETRALIEKLLH